MLVVQYWKVDIFSFLIYSYLHLNSRGALPHFMPLDNNLTKKIRILVVQVCRSVCRSACVCVCVCAYKCVHVFSCVKYMLWDTIIRQR